MTHSEIQDLRVSLGDLYELVRAKLEPVMDSMRLDLVNLSSQKHFFFQDSHVVESND
jgi:hypothetical protein